MTLMILGGIFIVLLLIAVGFSMATSMKSGTPLFGTATQKSAPTTNTGVQSNTSTQTAGTAFTLSDAQKQALSSFGIDPASVPSSISAEQEACFVAALGSARVSEIKAGATPSAMDFFKVKGCI